MCKPSTVLLRTTLAAIVMAPATAGAAASACHLRLFNTHTSKRVDLVYRIGDAPIPEALGNLQSFLCDHRNGDQHPFDPALFDILRDLAHAVGRDEAEFQVISGYRSPETNAALRATRSGVAEHSLHMQARAIDIRLPGTSTARLRDAAIALHRGGVGYYRDLDFIHVDTGRVRRW
jgi:uncharacterized protein YcbK (DUF882 family)